MAATAFPSQNGALHSPYEESAQSGLKSQSGWVDQNSEAREARRQKSFTKSRPAPRPSYNDEIIQDGLGSDELIPSEWATGSRARFVNTGTTNAFRRAPTTDYDGTRAVGEGLGQQHHSPSWQHQEQQQDRLPSPNGGGHEDPPSPLGMLPGRDERERTTSAQSSVMMAREKARRLARERAEWLQSTPSPTVNGGEQWSEAREDMDGVSVYSRFRTVSNPGLSNYKQSRLAIDEQAKTGTSRPSSKNSMLDGQQLPASRIPLPASGSMSKFTKAGTPEPKLRPSKSASLIKSYDSPPQPDGFEEKAGSRTHSPTAAGTRTRPERNQPIKGRKTAPASTSATGRTGAAKKYGALQNSPPTQDVLDQFGPLGGSPRHATNGMRGVSEGAAGEFGANPTRSVSNPWDEELLPTVKRRLAQQAMAERDPRFSDVDGLIDTWDRFGMPLSTRSISSAHKGGIPGEQGDGSVSPPQAEGREDIADGTSTDQASSAKSNKAATTASTSGSLRPGEAEGQSDRLRRLTAQLDMGLHGDGQPQGQQRQPQADEQRSRQQQQQQQRQQQRPAHAEGKEQQQQMSASLPQRPHRQDGQAIEMAGMGTSADAIPGNDPAFRAAQKKAGTGTGRPDASEEQDGAGCCKCTVM